MPAVQTSEADCPLPERAPTAAAAQQQWQQQQQQQWQWQQHRRRYHHKHTTADSHHGHAISGLAIKLAFPLLSPGRRATVSCRGVGMPWSRGSFAPEPRFGRVEGSRSQPLASLFGSANHGHVEKQRLRLPTLPITTRFGPEYCVQFRFCHLACRIRAIFTRRRLCSHSRPLQSKTPPPTLALPPRNLNPISKSRVRSLAAEPTHGVPVAVGSTLAGRSA